MTINEMIALHNDLAPASMKLNTWKKSKAELQARIDRLKPARGVIGRTVEEFVRLTDLPYCAIETHVRKMFPNARTSRRSIASVAADLRRNGVQVPYRRKPSQAA